MTNRWELARWVPADKVILYRWVTQSSGRKSKKLSRLGEVRPETSTSARTLE